MKYFVAFCLLGSLCLGAESKDEKIGKQMHGGGGYPQSQYFAQMGNPYQDNYGGMAYPNPYEMMAYYQQLQAGGGGQGQYPQYAMPSQYNPYWGGMQAQYNPYGMPPQQYNPYGMPMPYSSSGQNNEDMMHPKCINSERGNNCADKARTCVSNPEVDQVERCYTVKEVQKLLNDMTLKGKIME